MNLKGWIERDGVRLTPADVERMLEAGPEALNGCGGEFLLSRGDCIARDAFGVMPGPVPPGTVWCGGREVARIAPDPPSCTLEEAIVTAVNLRSDEGVVAFSGGVDSGLVAGLAHLPCVTVGIEGSHDSAWAAKAARMMGLELTIVSPTEEEVVEALARVVEVIPDPTNPVEASIAATMYFAAAWGRGGRGDTRILAGAGSGRTLRRLRALPHLPGPRGGARTGLCGPQATGGARPGGGGAPRSILLDALPRRPGGARCEVDPGRREGARRGAEVPPACGRTGVYPRRDCPGREESDAIRERHLADNTTACTSKRL